MKSDAELLRQFAETRDEKSFAILVQRHIGLVYAVNLRRLRDSHVAKDATQAVFVALARKAQAVAQSPSVIGWLHRSATFESRNIMRSRTHRLAREAEAHRRETILSEPRLPLHEIDAVLDDALDELPENDREAVIARFFAGRSYGEIGSTLRLTDNAARMRVERALEKLRGTLAKRGITSTAAILTGTLPTYAAASVAPGIVAIVTKAAILSVARSSSTASIVTYLNFAKLGTGAALVVLVCGTVYYHLRDSNRDRRSSQMRIESEASRTQPASVYRDITELDRRIELERPLSGDPTTVEGTPTLSSAARTSAHGVSIDPPSGWRKNGSAHDRYEVGVDANHSWGGMPSAYARSTGVAKGKFGGMMQTISAEAYRNQRVRLSGWMKTEDANDGGGHLWFRIDGKEGSKTLGFDNMDGREARGTTDWQDYSIVLDVPAEAGSLHFGFFVAGHGMIWVSGVILMPVDTSVPTTNQLKPPPELPRTLGEIPTAPVNLGFAVPPG